ncbi:MAG: branched-chain amino acid ABC transporter permease [Clostridia bacterium]|nr:branched-chain amino acid ABC transporter permease [Clostridia bacterium]
MSQSEEHQANGPQSLLTQAEVASGLADGLPIGLGYFAVSFAFGLAAVEGGLAAWVATVISLTNLTSAGQFAGLQLMLAHRPLVEIALTTVLINLRYMLMSLSLSQKLAPGTGLVQRLLIGFGVTDEIYAVSVSQPGLISTRYSLSLLLLPLLGWTGGTLTGALAGSVLPVSVRAALGIALYAMFVAIVMPTIRHSRPVALVAGVAAGISTLIALAPPLAILRGGWQIILATIVAAALGAVLAPIHVGEPGQTEEVN